MEDRYVLPWWARVLIGLAVIGVCFWKLPMLEIFQLFFYICIIPLVVLTGLGMVASGTVDAFGDNFAKFQAETKRRVREQYDQLRKQQGQADPPPEAQPQG
jgi:hypothetical protein